MLDRNIRRRVERALYDYKRNKELGVEAIVELAENGLIAKYESIGGSSNVGNPTENKAIKAVEGSESVMWCRVVEETLKHFCNTGKDILIRLKYFEKVKEKRICEKLFIERSAFFDWLTDALTYASMIALQFGLVKIV